MDQHVMEIVRFGLVAGVTPRDLVEAARGAETWLTAQPGFVGRRLGRCDEDTWVDWVEWADMASAKTAAAQFMDAPATAAFLAMIDIATVDMRHCVIEVAV